MPDPTQPTESPADDDRVWQAALDAVLQRSALQRGVLPVDVARGAGPSLVFQPIVDLKRAAVVGYEALSRFPAVNGLGPMPPPARFEAARRLGCAADLESRVLLAALDARDRLPPNTFLTVNLSPWALSDPEVQGVLLGDRDLGRLVIEITENAVVDDYERLAEVVAAARRRGAYLAVDDAGAGYASLSHILELRPDFVKLDRALVTALDTDEAKLALLEMFGQFAGRVDAWLLAEGVETPAEMAALVRLGVTLAQGYLLGRPSSEWTVLSAPTRATLFATASATHARDTAERSSRRAPSSVNLTIPRWRPLLLMRLLALPRGWTSCQCLTTSVARSRWPRGRQGPRRSRMRLHARSPW